MAQLLGNNLKTTLSAAITTAGQTSITVSGGSVFPAITAPDTMTLCLDDGTNLEIVKCTAHTAASTTLTITRAQESTTAQASFAIGTKVEMRLTSGGMSQLITDANAAAATLTNKRITKRVYSTTSSTTPTPDSDNYDVYKLTALAAGATFGAPTGTPTDEQLLMIEIYSAAAQTLAFNAAYIRGANALPTTTVAGKYLRLLFVYETQNTLNKWRLIAVDQEA